MIRRQVVVMVKQPRAGRVKSRLARDIGTVPAAWWQRHQLARLLRTIGHPRWRVFLAVSPDNASLIRANSCLLPGFGQGRGDLGQRMARIFRRMPPGPVVIIGADIPGVAPAHLARAFAVLGRRDAVFGPATDGGYWLAGFARRRALPPRLFEGVRWSTGDALGDTISTLAGQGFELTDTLRDVDSAADLKAAIG